MNALKSTELCPIPRLRCASLYIRLPERMVLDPEMLSSTECAATFSFQILLMEGAGNRTPLEYWPLDIARLKGKQHIDKITYIPYCDLFLNLIVALIQQELVIVFGESVLLHPAYDCEYEDNCLPNELKFETN